MTEPAGTNRLHREVFHVTFRTQAEAPEGQPERRVVHGEAVRARHHAAGLTDGGTAVDLAPITYDTDVTFTSETTFRETGVVRVTDVDTIRISTAQEGVAVPSGEPGKLHGAISWRIDGGTGRFEHATGLITANAVFETDGEGVDEQLWVVFTQ